MKPAQDTSHGQAHTSGGMEALVLAILETELQIKEGLLDEQEGRMHIQELERIAQNPADVHQAMAAMGPPSMQ